MPSTNFFTYIYIDHSWIEKLFFTCFSANVFYLRNQFIRNLVQGPPQIKKILLELQKIFISVDSNFFHYCFWDFSNFVSSFQ